MNPVPSSRPAETRAPAGQASPLVSFRHVFKTYVQASGELHALRDVSFGLRAGGKLAIVGRSGSGKSTLLHLAAGIDVPSEGTVEFRGRDLGQLTDNERTLERRDRIGLVFQFFHLLPHLTVWENVVLPSWIAGENRMAYRDRARDLLERVGLGARSGDPAQNLSGGEMQRVAICRALIRSPELVLADEPTGNLDDENARRVMDLLMQLVEGEKGALIFVTHSLDLADRADERFRLKSGVLVAV